jgi:hypothetical protein
MAVEQREMVHIKRTDEDSRITKLIAEYKLQWDVTVSVAC